MFNAANKLMAAALIAAAMVSCGESDKDKAQALVDEASALVERGDYSGAIAVVDTLDARYAREIAVRKAGLLCRARAVEGLTKDSIIAVDDLLARSLEEIGASENDYRYIEMPNGIDGYLIAKSIYDRDAMNKTCIQPRIDEYFILAVNIRGRRIGFERITAGKGGQAVSTVAVNPSRMVTVEGSEMVTLTQEEAAPLVEYLMANPEVSECRLCGAKGSVDLKLTPAMRDAIVGSYRYALALQANRLAQIKREKFERQLQMARDQIANSMPSEPAEN